MLKQYTSLKLDTSSLIAYAVACVNHCFELEIYMGHKEEFVKMQAKDSWKAVEAGAATLFEELPVNVQQQYGPEIQAQSFVLDKHLFD